MYFLYPRKRPDRAIIKEEWIKRASEGLTDEDLL